MTVSGFMHAYTRLGELILASRPMHNVSSSYFDADSLMTVAPLAASFLYLRSSGQGQAWSQIEGVVWPAFELHYEQLQLASSGNQFQKSTTFKPIALLPASC